MILALLFSFVFSWPAPNISGVDNADESYYVIMTKGNIVLKSNGKAVTRGTTIKSSQAVVFKSKDAKAIMLSRTRGRFIMAYRKASKPGSELVAFVTEVISPLKTNSKLSTRGFGEAEAIKNFKDYFGDSTFVIIGDRLPFKVNTSLYPLDDNHILLMRYEYKTQDGQGKILNRTIGFKGNVATLDRYEHFVDGKDTISVDRIKGNVEFYHLTYKDGFSPSARPSGVKRLSTFKPLFVNEEEVKAQVTELVSFFKDQEVSNAELKEEITAYIWDVYGKTDNHLLEDWLIAQDFISKEKKSEE